MTPIVSPNIIIIIIFIIIIIILFFFIISVTSHHNLSHTLSQSHETGMSWYGVGPDSFWGGHAGHENSQILVIPSHPLKYPQLTVEPFRKPSPLERPEFGIINICFRVPFIRLPLWGWHGENFMDATYSNYSPCWGQTWIHWKTQEKMCFFGGMNGKLLSSKPPSKTT